MITSKYSAPEQHLSLDSLLFTRCDWVFKSSTKSTPVENSIPFVLLLSFHVLAAWRFDRIRHKYSRGQSCPGRRSTKS